MSVHVTAYDTAGAVLGEGHAETERLAQIAALLQAGEARDADPSRKLGRLVMESGNDFQAAAKAPRCQERTNRGEDDMTGEQDMKNRTSRTTPRDRTKDRGGLAAEYASASTPSDEAMVNRDLKAAAREKVRAEKAEKAAEAKAAKEVVRAAKIKKTAKKAKTAEKKAKSGKAVRDGVVRNHGGRLGEIFGFAVTAVLRRLGLEGVDKAGAAAVLKAKGINMPEHSMDVQLGLGRTRARPVAPLMDKQVQELKALIPAPETAAAA
jgi:hypothetical protein